MSAITYSHIMTDYRLYVIYIVCRNCDVTYDVSQRIYNCRSVLFVERPDYRGSSALNESHTST